MVPLITYRRSGIGKDGHKIYWSGFHLLGNVYFHIDYTVHVTVLKYCLRNFGLNSSNFLDAHEDYGLIFSNCLALRSIQLIFALSIYTRSQTFFLWRLIDCLFLQFRLRRRTHTHARMAKKWQKNSALIECETLSCANSWLPLLILVHFVFIIFSSFQFSLSFLSILSRPSHSLMLFLRILFIISSWGIIFPSVYVSWA